MNSYRYLSCASLLAFGALIATADVQAADAPALTATANINPPTGGLSAANGNTRELNKPVVVLQVGRTF